MDGMTFHQKLRAYLGATDTKVSVLARKMGVPDSTVRQWMNGRCEPTLYNLKLLVKATGWSADWWVM